MALRRRGHSPVRLTSVPSEQLVPRSIGVGRQGFEHDAGGDVGTSPGYASTSVAPRVGEPFEYRVAVGALADVAELKHAMDAGDDGTMGRLLGFPDCCIASSARHGWTRACVDTTWAMARQRCRGRQRPADRDRRRTRRFRPTFSGGGWVRAPCPTCRARSRATPPWPSPKASMALGRENGHGAEMDGSKRF